MVDTAEVVKIDMSVGQIIDELERRTSIKPSVEHVRYMFHGAPITGEDHIIEVEPGDLDTAESWWQEWVRNGCRLEEPEQCAEMGDPEPAPEPESETPVEAPPSLTFVHGFQEVDRCKLVDALESIGLDEADEIVTYLFAGVGAAPSDPMFILEYLVESEHTEIGSQRPVRLDLTAATLRGSYLEVPSYYTWDPWPASIKQDHEPEYRTGGSRKAQNHPFTSNWVRLLVEGLLKARHDYWRKPWRDQFLFEVRDAVMLGDLPVSGIGRRVRQFATQSRPASAARSSQSSKSASDSSAASTTPTIQQEGSPLDEIKEAIERLAKYVVEAPAAALFIPDADKTFPDMCFAVWGDDANEDNIREMAIQALDKYTQEA